MAKVRTKLVTHTNMMMPRTVESLTGMVVCSDLSVMVRWGSRSESGRDECWLVCETGGVVVLG